jgi:hypothetical protein
VTLEDDETGHAAGWKPPGLPGEFQQRHTIQSPVDLETGMSIVASFWNPADDPAFPTNHEVGECSIETIDTSADRFVIGCEGQLDSRHIPREGATLTYIITK